jgi:hypothetical protein
MTPDEIRAVQALAACPYRTLQRKFPRSELGLVRYYGNQVRHGITRITDPDAVIFRRAFAAMLASNRTAPLGPRHCVRCPATLPAEFRERSVCSDCLTPAEIAQLRMARKRSDARNMARRARRDERNAREGGVNA